MAYFSLHAYDADVWVPEFKGLNQSDVNMNPDMRFAAEAVNMETPGGVLQPVAMDESLHGSETFPAGASGEIGTLICFTRRWYTQDAHKEWFICSRGGHIYQRQKETGKPWEEIDLPIGLTITDNRWSWVTYEQTVEPVGEDPYTIDVLLISNAKDGMFMISPPDRQASWGDAKEQNWLYHKGGTWMDMYSAKWTIQTIACRGKKFGSIERSDERVWGTAIEEEPDMLYYSAVNDPTDWCLYTPDPDPLDPYQKQGQPEDGSGEIGCPTWDGDKFYGLKKFGDQLLAFKEKHVWRILNSYPGEYTINEQFGEGTKYIRTVAIYEERVFMMTDQGLSVYDGMNTSPFMRDNVKDIWLNVDRTKLDLICGAVFDDKYYVSFTSKDDEYDNRSTLVYNLKEGTVLFYSGIGALCYQPTINELLYTMSGDSTTFLKKYDSWVTGSVPSLGSKWVSPWIDFGYKRIQKGGFDLYFVPEVKDEAMTLNISIQTEKKTKTKSYTIQPLTEEQLEAGREHRGKRLHFGGTGRKFRVIIETASEPKPWRLIGGLQMVVETDPD